MRDFGMHDEVSIRPHAWLPSIVIALVVVAASLALVWVFDDELADTSCGGG